MDHFWCCGFGLRSLRFDLDTLGVRKCPLSGRPPVPLRVTADIWQGLAALGTADNIDMRLFMFLYLALMVGLVAFHPGCDEHGNPVPPSPPSQCALIPVVAVGEPRGSPPHAGPCFLFASPSEVSATLGPPVARGDIYRWRYGRFVATCRVRAGFVATAEFAGDFDRDSLAELVRSQVGDDSARQINGVWVTESGVHIRFAPGKATFIAVSPSILSICEKM